MIGDKGFHRILDIVGEERIEAGMPVTVSPDGLLVEEHLAAERRGFLDCAVYCKLNMTENGGADTLLGNLGLQKTLRSPSPPVPRTPAPLKPWLFKITRPSDFLLLQLLSLSLAVPCAIPGFLVSFPSVDGLLRIKCSTKVSLP